jgi:hypothetical protein
VYELRERFIDEVICGRRHRIAHGARQPITTTELNEVVHEVVHLCDELNAQVQEAALYEWFKR